MAACIVRLMLGVCVFGCLERVKNFFALKFFQEFVVHIFRHYGISQSRTSIVVIFLFSIRRTHNVGKAKHAGALVECCFERCHFVVWPPHIGHCRRCRPCLQYFMSTSNCVHDSEDRPSDVRALSPACVFYEWSWEARFQMCFDNHIKLPQLHFHGTCERWAPNEKTKGNKANNRT